jgi:hypothetical protein
MASLIAVSLELPSSLSFGGTCRFCRCALSDGSPETRTNGLFHGYKHCVSDSDLAVLHCLVYYAMNRTVKIEDFMRKFSLNNLLIPRSDGSFSEGSVTLSKLDRFYFVRYSESSETWFLNVSFGDDMSKDIKLSDLIHSGIEQSTIDTMITYLNEGLYSETIKLLEAQLGVHIV